MSRTVGWNFDNSYARLPQSFASQVSPTPVRNPQIALVNDSLATALGLDLTQFDRGSLAAIFAGNLLPEGAVPIAQAYAGHQYGGFTMLGDGRAILLGEQLTPAGERFDIQLKGSGPTPFSRRGDGRAALGPMLREFVISEALHALGIATTRSLAVTTTGEAVYRETVVPGAILVRVAASHIRVGTFEYFAAREDGAGLKQLADYTLQRHYPTLVAAENPYQELLRGVIDRQAALIASWQHIGFVHGVMNTDNVSICGETIDYGPCAFMNAYDPATVFSSIDSQGRYAYGNQPRIGHWNMLRFAESLLPLLDADRATAVNLANAALEEFPQLYENYWLAGMRRKLGLATAQPEDAALIESLLSWMQCGGRDFTETFRKLSDADPLTEAHGADSSWMEWYERWQQRLKQEETPLHVAHQRMNATNPAIIPRNHLVEAALQAASRDGDMAPLERLLSALAQPFDTPEQFGDLRQPPSEPDAHYRTFCGT